MQQFGGLSKCFTKTKCTQSRPATLNHTRLSIGTNNYHKRCDGCWFMTSCHIQNPSETLSPKMFDYILELPPITADASWKIHFCSDHQVQQFISSSLLLLPALTLNSFCSEQKVVAMATIVNTSGRVIRHTHAHIERNTYVLKQICACVPIKNIIPSWKALIWIFFSALSSLSRLQ